MPETNNKKKIAIIAVAVVLILALVAAAVALVLRNTGDNGPEDANGNKTFCLYSMGNMVSNQRREYFPSSRGYTEDAIFVYTTFERDNDGRVTLTKVDYTPLWMNKYSANGRQNYRLEPCSGDSLTASQQSSKNRTDGLVAEGFRAYNK